MIGDRLIIQPIKMLGIGDWGLGPNPHPQSPEDI